MLPKTVCFSSFFLSADDNDPGYSTCIDGLRTYFEFRDRTGRWSSQQQRQSIIRSTFDLALDLMSQADNQVILSRKSCRGHETHTSTPYPGA